MRHAPPSPPSPAARRWRRTSEYRDDVGSYLPPKPLVIRRPQFGIIIERDIDHPANQKLAEALFEVWNAAMDNAQARNRMVEAQIARRGVRDPSVLEAMRTVPREAFISPGFEEFAYEDSALPIAEGQTISQPYIVAAMVAAAELEKADKVLEVGAGSG